VKIFILKQQIPKGKAEKIVAIKKDIAQRRSLS